MIIAYLGYQQFNNSGIMNITTDELAEKLKNDPPSKDVIYVDVREQHEYEAGHIEEMKNYPLSRFTEYLNMLPKDAEIVLICRSGNRSMKAANILKDNGYTDIVNVTGGMSSWTGAVVK
jgi:rhodanese-related sulfurtransferase